MWLKWFIVCSNGVNDDNVNQHLDAIHRNHNVDPPTHNKWWKDMGLLMYNVKICIPCNICKSIPHNIMGSHLFLTMVAMKKVDPHKVQKLTTNAMWQTKVKGQGRPNQMHNAMDKASKIKKKGIIGWTNNHTPTLCLAQDLTHVQCKSKMMLEK
jgi:hypothetical protein